MRFTTVVGQVGSILNRLDLDTMDRRDITLTGAIKRLLADTRLDIRDWEMADSRAEMQRHASEAVKRLEQSREAILLASEHNLFSPVDIAEISAQFDHFAYELRK
jgi:hypothetical protein